MSTARTAVIPAHNETATVRGVIEAVKHDVDEVLVVDSCSTDGTVEVARAAGARVVSVSVPGKHHAIRAGIEHARGDQLVFLDADLESPDSDIAGRMLQALVPGVALVKGYYRRPADFNGPVGGRLTELCARPLLALLYPSLGTIREPLAGEFAICRDLARRISLTPGYAVDVGILITCSVHGSVVEVDLGFKRHRHHSVYDLGPAAVEIAATILGLAGHGISVQLTQYPDGRTVVRSLDLPILRPDAKREPSSI